MLLPSRKPSSSYSLLKFVYVTSHLRHSLVVQPLLRKILDPPLNYIVYETNPPMFWARGSTTYAVNNCFSSFIYCFIAWIKYILLLCLQD